MMQNREEPKASRPPHAYPATIGRLLL